MALGGPPSASNALDLLLSQVYTTQNGALPHESGVARVSVVLMDGKSDQPPATIMSGLKAHAAAINMISVGIGGKYSHYQCSVGAWILLQTTLIMLHRAVISLLFLSLSIHCVIAVFMTITHYYRSR